jgi:hypothetical protein
MCVCGARHDCVTVLECQETERRTPHIHFLATGGIAVDLEADFQPDKSDEFKASGCVEVDSALLQAMLENPELFYVNIHNVDFPGGALAGLLSG